MTTIDLEVKQLATETELPVPMWDNSDNHFAGHTVRVLPKEIKAGWQRYSARWGNRFGTIRLLDNYFIIEAINRQELRRELTQRLWGERR